MKLIVKFNIALLLTLAAGLAACAWIGHGLLMTKARTEALQNARLMMEAAMATRTYTATRIHGLLENQMKYSFLPESVPSFAATEVFAALQRTHAEYSYKEATLNPTNPRDRVTDWEADVVQQFRREAGRSEIVGERDTPAGMSLYLARPIVVGSAACLQCHSTPEAAPKTLIDKYGPANGFGWKLNEVVGAQIVSVPSQLHTVAAQRAFRSLLTAIGGVFLFLFVVLNLVLLLLVLRPLKKMAAIAEQVSLGIESAPEFEVQGRDEIGSLARSFARMRTSLQKAMSMVGA